MLDAQRELFTAEQSLVQTRLQRLTNAVDVYRTLGGGLKDGVGTFQGDLASPARTASLQARGFLLTQGEATELLRKDVRIAERAVLRLISAPRTDGQFDTLVSFTFNLGAGVPQRSTLRRKVNRGEHESVPAELMKWVGRWEKDAWTGSSKGAEAFKYVLALTTLAARSRI